METEKTGWLKPRAAVGTTFFLGGGVIRFSGKAVGCHKAPKTIIGATASC